MALEELRIMSEKAEMRRTAERNAQDQARQRLKTQFSVKQDSVAALVCSESLYLYHNGEGGEKERRKGIIHFCPLSLTLILPLPLPLFLRLCVCVCRSLPLVPFYVFFPLTVLLQSIVSSDLETYMSGPDDQVERERL